MSGDNPGQVKIRLPTRGKNSSGSGVRRVRNRRTTLAALARLLRVGRSLGLPRGTLSQTTMPLAPHRQAIQPARSRPI